MKPIGVLPAMIVLCYAAWGQGETNQNMLWRTQVPELHLTGNAHVDFVGQQNLLTSPGSTPQAVETTSVTRKSPWIAAGLSLAVPGAGELYAGSFWKSAGFFALDVAAWVFAYTYDKRGDRQTDFFQNYANQNWSVVKYAQYALDHLAPKDPPGGPYQLFIPGPTGRPPWQQVDWPELNRMERDISATAAGQYYSHILPPYNDQQYYELIGKYPQFNQGWIDAPPTFTYGDPVTSHFTYYSDERGKANTYYTTASTFVTVAIVNHLLSAIDAAWSAHSYNGAHAEVGVHMIPAGDHLAQVPVVKLSYPF